MHIDMKIDEVTHILVQEKIRKTMEKTCFRHQTHDHVSFLSARFNRQDFRAVRDDCKIQQIH